MDGEAVQHGVEKAQELDFANRLQPLRRYADGKSADHCLCQRRIDHAVVSEPLVKTLGGPEDSTMAADIYAPNSKDGP